MIVVKLPSGSGSISIANPAQSTNFSDIGAGTYVSDERQLGQDIGFSVSYFAEDESFAIDISSKPIAQYRENASRYLLETLGITESEACQLKVYVGVTHDTDPGLSGKNLGLSFCADAIKL
jgi:hypothetical protein